MAILNGSAVLMVIAGEDVAHSNNVSFDLSAAEVEKTTKSSAGNKGVRPGTISGTAKVGGFTCFDGAGNGSYDVTNLEAIRSGRTKVLIQIGVGTKVLSAQAYMTDFAIVAGVEDNLTFDASFKFTGAITFAS